MLRKITTLALILCAGAFLFFIKGEKQSSPPTFPVVEKKPFVIVIPTFNDAMDIQSTLFSAYEQRYDHFRIILIDDHSTDQTVQKAVEYTAFHRAADKTTLIQNSSHCGILGSIYNAIHLCHDHEIALILLGGDRLASPDALQELNRAYANPETWMTYGTSLDFPSYAKTKIEAKPISKKVTQNQLLRKSPWSFPLPYSFYTTLFKEIPIEELFYRGRFCEMGWEYAIGFPLLELAAGHTQIIKTPLYLSDQKSKNREDQFLPSFYHECEAHIRNRPSLTPLTRLPSHSHLEEETADLLIFSNDRPMQLFALLESVERHVLGIHQITVFYESSSGPSETGYLEVQLQFPKVQFLKKEEDFKAQLMNTGFAPSYSGSPYVLLATDRVIISDLIHLDEAIESLETTHAYGVYFDLHKELNYSSQLKRYQPIPITTPLTGINTASVEAWQISWARDDWSNPGSLHFALYRKGDLAPLLAGLDFEDPEEMSREWNLSHQGDVVGLFYDQPKSICLRSPKNPATDLEKFLGGLKLDLSSFFQLTGPSRDLSIDPSYISRE